MDTGRPDCVTALVVIVPGERQDRQVGPGLLDNQIDEKIAHVLPRPGRKPRFLYERIKDRWNVASVLLKNLDKSFPGVPFTTVLSRRHECSSGQKLEVLDLLGCEVDMNGERSGEIRRIQLQRTLSSLNNRRPLLGRQIRLPLPRGEPFATWLGPSRKGVLSGRSIGLGFPTLRRALCSARRYDWRRGGGWLR